MMEAARRLTSRIGSRPDIAVPLSNVQGSLSDILGTLPDILGSVPNIIDPFFRGGLTLMEAAGRRARWAPFRISQAPFETF